MSTPARRRSNRPASVASRRSTRSMGPVGLTEASSNLPPLRATSLSYGGAPNHAVSSVLNVPGTSLSQAIQSNAPELPGITEEREETRPLTADESTSLIDRSKSFANPREQGLRGFRENGSVEPEVGVDQWVEGQRVHLFGEETEQTTIATGPSIWKRSMQALPNILATFAYFVTLLAIGYAIAMMLLTSSPLDRIRSIFPPSYGMSGNYTPSAAHIRQVESRLASLESSLSSMAVLPKWTSTAKGQLRSLESTQNQHTSELANLRRTLSSQLKGSNKDASSALRHINFFSSKLGARINRKFTSPTLSHTLTWQHKLYSKLIWLPQPLPPAAVLEDWDDAADCWCAAASDNGAGLAQVGITLPTGLHVTPSRWTVEHMWKEGSFDMTTAPKTLELWLRFTTPEAAEKVREARAEFLDGAGIAQCSEANGLDGGGFVCVGKARYDIEGASHVQTYDLDLDLKGLGVAADEAVVRVTENYGREHTCLYRLRLHGTVAGREA